MCRASCTCVVNGVSSRSRFRAVIFDGDDTLWLTEALYDAARSTARDIVERAGLDGEAWELQQRRRDLENVALHGHSADRFPRSCVEALDLTFGTSGWLTEELRERVADVARSVFTAPAPLRDGATEVLDELKRREFRLALLSKGDQRVQRRRIADSGLAEHFEVISIVDAKTPESFESVVQQLTLRSDQVVSVGNSVASDIQPSLAAGVAAVWLPAYVWEYENRHALDEERSLTSIRTLQELLDIVG